MLTERNSNMKKIVFFLAFVLCAQLVAAQSMTDEQVVNFIMAEHQNGVSEMEITKKLLKKGVSVEQIKKIGISLKAKADKKSGVGAIDDDDAQASKRVRYTPKSGDYPVSQSSTKVKSKQAKRKPSKNEPLYDYFNSGEETEEYAVEEYEEEEEEIADSLKIFGHDIFTNEMLTFEPAANIPLPATYKLGAGDQVIIDIWGASQVTIDEYISAEGYIVIDGVGPIFLAGKTLDDASKYLGNQLNNVYSGSKISVTVGKIRSIQVQVMGEVVTPGTYTLSALSTAFNALYAAGGISPIGTLRDIAVFRNGKKVATIDVYDYILNGKTDTNIRLQDDDVISVGAYKGVVDLRGKVKRPMRYEIIPGETMLTVISYAGGFAGDAYTDNINIVRKSGREYSMHTVDKQEAASFEMKDGDAVKVDAMLTRFSNMIEIAGAVFYPGQYELGKKISTVGELVKAAGGLTEGAFMERAILQHRNFDNTIETEAVDIKGVIAGTAPDVKLKNNDLLYIPVDFKTADERTLSIKGEVKFPGNYKYSENVSVKDLILQAGGFTREASVMKIDVYRTLFDPFAVENSETKAQVFSISLKEGFELGGDKAFILQPFDEVFVRRNPSYSKKQIVTIDGCVNFSGGYAIPNANYRLSDLVKSAGGFTSTAYVNGACLYRKMTPEERKMRESAMKTAQIQMLEENLRDNAKDIDMQLLDSLMMLKLDLGETYPVAINLKDAMENPGSVSDVVLRDGDILNVPEYVSTIRVSGEVNHPLTLSYEKGKNVKYYIKHAGGYSISARKKGVYIVYMNGNVVNVSRRSKKVVEPGCEIIVPRKGVGNKLSATEIAALGTSSASIATMIVAIINMLKN